MKKEKRKIWYGNRQYDQEVISPEEEVVSMKDVGQERVENLMKRSVRAEKDGDMDKVRKLQARIEKLKELAKK